MVDDFFDVTDLNYTPTTTPGATSQIEGILNRIPEIIDAWRRPAMPANVIPTNVQTAGVGNSNSNLMMLVLAGVLLWAVTR